MDRPPTSRLEQRLIAEAAAAHPLECCGLLLGRANAVAAVVPCRNVHPSPERHFEIDPVALIAAHREARTGGLEIIGYYHSHPSGQAEPSVLDAAQAGGDGRLWAIVAGGVVTWWRDGEGTAKAGRFAPSEPPRTYGSDLSPERSLP